MRKETKKKDFIQKPTYPGGNKAMSKFIYSSLRYPKEALDQRVEGTVVIRYGIDYKGNVTDTKVISGLGNGCDEEAVRVVKQLKFKVGKAPRKVRVLHHKTIKITFKIPPVKKVASYQYKITKKDPPKGEKKKNPSTVYTYTIRIKK